MNLGKLIPLSPLAEIVSFKKKQNVFCFLVLLGIQLTAINSFAQYTKLLDFGSTQNGMNPYSTPVSDGTFLYGMTANGGANNLGTIYKIKPDGTGFVKLLDFNETNGSNPYGSLFWDGTFLYGMTYYGGANNGGVIFKIKTDGSGFVTLFDFDPTTSGGYPYGSLISDGTFLYGMTGYGGPGGYGTAFKIKQDGSGYTVLISFNSSGNGAYPYGSLVFDKADNTILYGMTSHGGANGVGTIFKVNTDATGYSLLYTFSNSTGSSPSGSLITDGTYLYGTTTYGGIGGNGVIFKIMTDGSNYSVIVNFDYTTNGGYPLGDLVFDETGAFLCGMNTQKNTTAQGIIFKVKIDGSGFTNLKDIDVGAGGSGYEGTLLRIGSTLYGVRSGHSTNYSGIGYIGSIFKINTDGSGYTKLYNYEATANTPSGSLISDGTFLYGMASQGGLYNNGIVFKIKPDGTGYTKLFDMDGTNTGKHPNGSLVTDGTFLYGMTLEGGAGDDGIIFKIKTDGTGFTKLADCNATNGNYPKGSLVFDAAKTFLYGMTNYGGATSNGTIFKIKTDGTYTKLRDLDGTNDGGSPYGSLFFDGTFLYGTANVGGANDYGTIFKIKPDGSGFFKLLDFDDTNNGSYPLGDLYSDGTFLYAMASDGGLYSDGTIIKIKTDGTNYAKLLDFDYNNTGSAPTGSLISDDGVSLYGMTSYGGALGRGTIFQIKSDGTGYTKVMDVNDGAFPQGSLYSDGTLLYGMTQSGGVNDFGTVFKFTKTPFVSITGFTPSSGPIGALMRINGLNFDPIAANNIVKFNNVAAIVKSSTATTITVVVPAGATSGAITVTAGTTATSANNFTVTTKSYMFDGSVQSCNTQFTDPGGESSDVVETFYPNNPLTDKIQVSFSSFTPGNDALNVYDGPSTSSPLIVSLGDKAPPANIVSTSPGGELTFEFIWGDGTSTRWIADISCQTTTGATITITTQPGDFSACVGDVATFTTAASGTTNIVYQWQYSPDGVVPFTDITNGTNYSNANTATLSVNTTGNFGAGRYRCKVDGDYASTVYTNDEGLFIKTVPTIPTTSDVNNCGAGSVTLTASGGINGNYLWYDSKGLISGQSNSTYVTPVISTTTNYSVAITNGTCTSAPVGIKAIINSVPSAPTTQGAAACPNNTFTLTASGGTNGQYVWYTTASGGSAISGEVNSTYVTPVLTTTTTFYVSINDGTCESARTPVVATVSNCTPPVIDSQPLATQIGGQITLDLKPLIKAANLDLNSLQITIPPSSGATASIDANGILTIDYVGKSFAGTEKITIKACDLNGQCSSQDFSIDVAGDILVFNGISPNGANPKLILQYIDIIPETKNNTVYIFDRWENLVWHGNNYDNNSVAFTGVGDGGGELPSGVYFYKIDFASGRKTKTGFISLRRQ